MGPCGEHFNTGQIFCCQDFVILSLEVFRPRPKRSVSRLSQAATSCVRNSGAHRHLQLPSLVAGVFILQSLPKPRRSWRGVMASPAVEERARYMKSWCIPLLSLMSRFENCLMRALSASLTLSLRYQPTVVSLSCVPV